MSVKLNACVSGVRACVCVCVCACVCVCVRTAVPYYSDERITSTASERGKRCMPNKDLNVCVDRESMRDTLTLTH